MRGIKGQDNSEGRKRILKEEIFTKIYQDTKNNRALVLEQTKHVGMKPRNMYIASKRSSKEKEWISE